jgi:threonine/homoserine/homoserine lactone efflux protein
MFEWLGIMLAGIALGLSIAAPPGPVNALIAVQAIANSKKNGFLVGLGALTADSIFLFATYCFGNMLIMDDKVRGILSVISCIIMAYLAYATFKSSKNIKNIASTRNRKIHLPYITGLTIGLTNPFQISWWASVGLTLIASIGILIIAGFFIGIFLWISLFPFTLNWLSKRFPNLYIITIYVSSVLLIAFSAWFFYSGLTLLT